MNLTLKPDQTLRSRLADEVDPKLPVGEVIADGEIMLEETQVASMTAASASALAANECENTAKELAEATLEESAGDDTATVDRDRRNANVQFSLSAAACQRIRNADYPRRILGPAAANSDGKTQET